MPERTGSPGHSGSVPHSSTVLWSRSHLPGIPTCRDVTSRPTAAGQCRIWTGFPRTGACGCRPEGDGQTLLPAASRTRGRGRSPRPGHGARARALASAALKTEAGSVGDGVPVTPDRGPSERRRSRRGGAGSGCAAGATRRVDGEVGGRQELDAVASAVVVAPGRGWGGAARAGARGVRGGTRGRCGGRRGSGCGAAGARWWRVGGAVAAPVEDGAGQGVGGVGGADPPGGVGPGDGAVGGRG